MGAENAKAYQNLIYLGASASAEFIADIALCPFEAVKVSRNESQVQRSKQLQASASAPVAAPQA